MSKLTHLDESGAAHMVDVGAKPRRTRTAMARGRVRMSAEALDAIIEGRAPKGDVLAVARVAGIMAAKRTWELIPLCHQIALTSVKVLLEPDREATSVQITARVETVDRTGVEMEALTAVSATALTLYDMIKAIDKTMSIEDIHLVEKTGGTKSNIKDGIKVVSPLDDSPQVNRPGPLPVSQVQHEVFTTVPEMMALNTAPRPTPLQVQAIPRVVAPEPVVEAPAEEATAPTPVVSAANPPASIVETAGEMLAPRVEARRHHRAPPAPGPEMKALIKQVKLLDETSHEAIRAYLLTDRTRGAYLLGDLDMPYVEHARWYGVEEADGHLGGVLLFYSGLSMPAVLPVGEGAALEALLAGTRQVLPRRFFASYEKRHQSLLERYYHAGVYKQVVRMGLARANWLQHEVGQSVERMTHRDTAAIMRLYRHYPDNYFEPAQLDTGMYYGVRQEGELVSVAGIHVLSEAQDVAVLGNVVTHTDFRGRGLASQVVGRVLEALFERVGHLALNVEVTNTAAIACYKKFGFSEQGRFLEGWVERK